MKALGEATRFRITRVLEHAGGELCICELVDILRRPEYAVSRAARALLHAGIVSERRDGKLVYYRLADDPFVARLAGLLRLVPADDDGFLHDLDRLRWRTDIRSGDRCVVTSRPEAETPRKKPRVLFVCVHNSARSQLAEEYLRRSADDLFEVASAGLEPGRLNPYVVAALAEEGIDITAKEPRGVAELYRQGYTFSYVITVCSREAEAGCPVFPGPMVRLNWPFPDPSGFRGTEAEISAQVRTLAAAIRQRVEEFVENYRRAGRKAEAERRER